MFLVWDSVWGALLRAAVQDESWPASPTMKGQVRTLTPAALFLGQSWLVFSEFRKEAQQIYGSELF